MLRLTFLTLLMSALWLPAHAADDKTSEPKAAQTQEAPEEQVTDPETVPSKQAIKDSEKLHDAIEELIEDLPETQQRHFLTLYHTHNIVSVVKTVRHDIGSAVKACGEKNPDMASKMDKRFAGWKEKTAPILTEAEGQINNMIIAQDYAPPQEITQILNLANQIRAKGEAALNKVPVSSKEACESLYKTMKKSQNDVVKMMRETLISIPHAAQQEIEKDQGTPSDQTKDEQNQEE